MGGIVVELEDARLLQGAYEAVYGQHSAQRPPIPTSIMDAQAILRGRLLVVTLTLAHRVVAVAGRGVVDPDMQPCATPRSLCAPTGNSANRASSTRQSQCWRRRTSMSRAASGCYSFS